MIGTARLSNGAGPLGTAFLVGERYLLTACHCVREDDGSIEPVVTAAFPDGSRLSALVVDWDERLDIAVLWLRDRLPAGIDAVPLGPDAAGGRRFTAPGFPVDLDRYEGRPPGPYTISGEIIRMPESEAPEQRMQLWCREATAGNPLHLPGMSGAAVIDETGLQALGVLVWNLATPLEAARGGVCYAVPMSMIIRRWPYLQRFVRTGMTGGRLITTWYSGNHPEQERKIREFVGRGEERARLIRHLLRVRVLNTTENPAAGTGHAQICVIHGPSGSGKTTLAYQVIADLITSRESSVFTNGWVDVNARGYDLHYPELDPGQTLQDALVALGRPVEELSRVSVGVLSTLLRRDLAERQLILLIDNVSDYELIHELLRAAPSCGIIVTGRSRLPDILRRHEQVAEFGIGRFAEREALVLLRAGLAPKAFDNRSARTIAMEICAGLPIAIAVCNAVLRRHPTWTTKILAEELTAQPPLIALAEFDQHGASIEKSFSLSYTRLDPSLQSAFRLLGSMPPSGFSAWSAAKLLGVSLPRATLLLERLADYHLIESLQMLRGEQAGENPAEPTTDHRYQFHDLVWAYARELLEQDMAGYLGSGHANLGNALWSSGRHALSKIIERPVPDPSGQAPQPVDDALRDVIDYDPRQWLRTERGTILATAEYAVRAEASDLLLVRPALLLAYLTEVFPIEGRERIRYQHVLEVGRTSAGQLGSTASVAEFSLALGRLAITVSHWPEARDLLEAATMHFTDIGDTRGEAVACSLLGDTLRELSSWPDAREQFDRAILLFTEAGMERDCYETYPKLGRIHRYLGDWSRAAALFTETLVGLEDDNRYIAQRVCGAARHDLGDLLRDQGKLDEALDHLRHGEEIFRTLQDELAQARIASSYVDVYRDLRLWSDAERSFASCDSIFEKYGDTRWRGRTQLNYAIVFRYRDMYERALSEAVTARTLLGSINDPKGQAMWHETLGVIKTRLSHKYPEKGVMFVPEARDHLDAALTYFTGVGERLWTAKTQWAMANLVRLNGDEVRFAELAAAADRTCDDLGAVRPSVYEPALEGPS